ncbi:hypothetical protein M472_03935 [Sphingobacterium paucimobilis HER1398]|uniref:Uncharacterized protein n=2 Tax=Sphingobacterium TaxID=28453 RepID=U2HRI8_9SPHI|nr:hypothetical protein M472_03935 [Sphingobacterium paucimobilis HER1398]
MFFTCYLGVAAQNKNTYVCTWGEATAIDTNLIDWSDTQYLQDDVNELRMAFKQDSTFVYMTIDKTYNAKKAIQLGGVQIHFSTVGKELAVTYPACKRNINNGIDYDFDYLVVDLLPHIKSDTIPIYNDLGIIANGKYSISTKSAVPVVRSLENLQGNDRFIMELRIPKEHLSVKESPSQEIKVDVAVRGNDIDKSGAIFEEFRVRAERNNTSGSLLFQRYKQLNLSSENTFYIQM